ncbi:MAG TPA: GAF domain-containing protein [Oscillatoriaceae cyanobacterium]
MDRAPTLRTYLWLGGSGFIVAASASFLAYLIVPLPWWVMTVLLGCLVGAVVMGLEHVLARPLERLVKLASRTREGTLPPPSGPLAAAEISALWKALRGQQEQLTQARHAQHAIDTQALTVAGKLRLLSLASRALRPDVSLGAIATEMMADLAALLGLSEVYLVPLRRHCPVPVTGPAGTPEWSEAIRASGLGPWEDLLVQDRPVAVCLTDLSPSWRKRWERGTLWIVPLNYHGRAQGMLLAPVVGAERTWTSDELELLGALSQILAAALHPPRWSDERGPKPLHQRVVPVETVIPEVHPEDSRRTRRRSKQTLP